MFVASAMLVRANLRSASCQLTCLPPSALLAPLVLRGRLGQKVLRSLCLGLLDGLEPLPCR
eukprot:10883872-Heterocapsa_arctica.AAC.1